jgi:hypothetical protein
LKKISEEFVRDYHIGGNGPVPEASRYLPPQKDPVAFVEAELRFGRWQQFRSLTAEGDKKSPLLPAYGKDDAAVHVLSRVSV